MKTKTKKIIIIAVMVVLLGVTGYLNIALNSSATQQTSGGVTLDFYTKYRDYREETRSKELLIYESILNNASSTAEQIADAQSKMKAIQATLSLEFALESQIGVYGYDDVVVSCSSDIINVMVKAESLTQNQVDQIVSILQRETNAVIDNIKIIPVE